MLTSSSSASSYSSQYLQPDYFRPLTPTDESKPSPLTLLAQTCNSIGQESSSTSSSSSSAAAKSKSEDDVKISSLTQPRDTPSDAGRVSTSRDPQQTDADNKDVATARTRRTSSPVDVAVASGSSTATAATAGSLSADLGRRRGRSPSPTKASPTPPRSGLTSPFHRGADGKLAGEYGLASSVHGGTDPDGLYAMQYLAAVAALQRQSAAVDAGLLPYLAAQRLPSHPLASVTDKSCHCPGGGPLLPVAGRLKAGSCSDPCCSRCSQLSAVAAAVATSSRGAGCVGCPQCGNHPQPTTSSSVLPPGGHGAFAAALSALCRLPPPPALPGTESTVVGASSTSSVGTAHTCNWLHPSGAYCGQRFSTVDELMQHLHSHCGTAAEPHTVPFAPDLHPVAAGSLFAPLAVLYGASSSYPTMDFMPPSLPPPAAAHVQLPSTTVSPSSLLRQHHHHNLAMAAAAAATRYHPYRVPPTLFPPSAASAAYPTSLAAYYGAMCGVTPGSNGTVPAVRL